MVNKSRSRQPLVFSPEADGYVWGVEYARPTSDGFRANLEAEARLHLDRTRAEGILRFAKMRVHDVCLNVRKIDLVEEVVEIGSEFQFGVLAKHWQFWQSKKLADGRVNIEIAWTTEEVASDGG